MNWLKSEIFSIIVDDKKSSYKLTPFNVEYELLPDASHNGRTRYVRSVSIDDYVSANVRHTNIIVASSATWVVSQYESYDGASSWRSIGRSYTRYVL